MRRRITLLAAAVAGSGCAAAVRELPPVDVQAPLACVIEERPTGPIVVIFPGRSAPTDDVTLGVREAALEIGRRLDGSVALASWKVYDAVVHWTEGQARQRRRARERVRLALVGHSWGGEAAGRFARETLSAGTVDEVSVLVTIDAIEKGYARSTLNWFVSFFSLEWLFGYRLPVMAFRGTPPADGTRIVRHVNYYQLDSPILHGAAIPTATENHEVWLDGGSELGHGNLDNFLIDIIAEDVRRAFLEGGDR
jgi:hypothetical protein